MRESKWTEESCYKAALECDNITMFAQKYSRAYEKSKINGWIKEYTWFEVKEKPKKYWEDKNNCYEEAMKYNSKTDFKNKSGSAYNVAKKNNWLDEWFTNKNKRGEYTKEYCLKIASNFSTRAAIDDAYPYVYRVMKKNNWFEDCDWLLSEFEARSKGMMGKKTIYTYDYCYNIAHDCKTKTEFKKKNKGAHDAALRNHWMEKWDWFVRPDICAFNENETYKIYAAEFPKSKAVYIGLTKERRKNRRQWEHSHDEKSAINIHAKNTGEEPIYKIVIEGVLAEDAQYYEGYYTKEYSNNDWLILNKAPTGIGLSSLGGGAMKYSEEEIEEEAKKYSSRYDFAQNNSAMYHAASRRKMLDKLFGKLNRRSSETFTKDYCINVARNYRTRTALQKGDSRVYEHIRKNRWFSDCDWILTKSECAREAAIRRWQAS